MKVVQAADWLAMRLSSGAGGRAGTPKTADDPSKHAMAFAACSSPTSCLTRLRLPAARPLECTEDSPVTRTDIAGGG
eukprot:scaffold109611_cov36-Phaeocystis_antarctica.AAC.2